MLPTHDRATRTGGRPVRVHARRAALIATALVALLATLPGASAPAAAATGAELEAEQDFLALVNVERARRGLGALTVASDITSVARRHSARMADDSRLHHNPTFSTEITGWQRVSENVGRGPSVGAIHRAFMESDGHRANIVDAKVTEVGVGVVIEGGRVWVTQNFRRPSSTATTSPPSTTDFGDVSSASVHADSITLVSSRRIAEACGTARFCPDASVTRAEFAAMLVRALDLPASPERHFTDVSGPLADEVDALAAAGLTAGCATGRFCPDQQLTREQLATFFANALQLRPGTSPFTDVGSTHAGSIGALYEAGITSGCTGSSYCPTRKVTRAQTATMLASNFG